MSFRNLNTDVMDEEQLGESVRQLCAVLGWRFLWLRKTYNSSKGILDLLLIPTRQVERRHTLFRELKGYDRNGHLGELTPEQVETIDALTAAGDDAAMWIPDDWTSGRIEKELA